MKNKKVCLISPPSRAINHFRPPVALLYLAGYLEKNGIECDLIDPVLDKQIRDKDFYRNLKATLKDIEREIIEEIEHSQPDVVGITCYTPEYFEVLNLAKAIKKLNRQTKIIVGGIHPTFHPQDFISKNSPVDFVVLGEGELTLLELIKKIDHPQKWLQIGSISYYDSTKGSVITKKRDLATDLDSIAFPAYHKLDMNYYSTANPYAIRGVFTRSAYILSSRGCPSQCTFCVAKKIREVCNYKNYARLRTPKSLFNEIKSLRKNYKIDAFYFIDDLFTLNKKHVLAFCRLLQKSGMKLIWGCSSKVSTVDFEILTAMKKAGCVQIDFGVERGSDEALMEVKKGITIESVKRVFADCDKLGIRTFANMLVNLPGETKKDLEDILSLLDEIKATIVSINIFTPYPGTEIFDTHKTGISKKDYPNLMKDAAILIKKEPRKYRFASHRINFGKWVSDNSKKYNRTWPQLRFYLSQTYLSNWIASSKKLNYFEMVGLLLKEFINQKF